MFLPSQKYPEARGSGQNTLKKKGTWLKKSNQDSRSPLPHARFLELLGRAAVLGGHPQGRVLNTIIVSALRAGWEGKGKIRRGVWSGWDAIVRGVGT